VGEGTDSGRLLGHWHGQPVSHPPIRDTRLQC